MGVFLYRIVYLLILISIGFFSGGCGLFENEQGDAIIWEDEDLNEFIIYAYAPDGDSFAVIDLITGEIYQHMQDFEGIQSVAASEDGTHVYISTGTGPGGAFPGFIYRLNTFTWEHEIIYEQAVHLIENRNGGIFFITKEVDSSSGYAISDRMFGEINPSTGAITEIDSINVDWGAWYDSRRIEVHSNQSLLYAVNESGNLYQFNYATSATNIFPELSFPPLHASLYLEEEETHSISLVVLFWMCPGKR